MYQYVLPVHNLISNMAPAGPIRDGRTRQASDTRGILRYRWRLRVVFVRCDDAVSFCDCFDRSGGLRRDGGGICKSFLGTGKDCSV